MFECRILEGGILLDGGLDSYRPIGSDYVGRLAYSLACSPISAKRVAFWTVVLLALSLVALEAEAADWWGDVRAPNRERRIHPGESIRRRLLELLADLKHEDGQALADKMAAHGN